MVFTQIGSSKPGKNTKKRYSCKGFNLGYTILGQIL